VSLHEYLHYHVHDFDVHDFLEQPKLKNHPLRHKC
jgi:hypothetical protein